MMPLSNLTAIIPIDLSQRPVDIINKAKRILAAARSSKLKVSFGHNDLGTRHDITFKRLVNFYPEAEISSGKFYSNEVNTSLLRNEAFKNVKTPYTLLLDIDIWPELELFAKHLKKVESKEQPLSIIPCLYLTKLGSKQLTTKKVSPDKLKEKFFNYSRKEFLHLASPSSITILESNDYVAAGAFNEEFRGHGYEDFDFLVRLMSLHGKVSASADFLQEKSSRSPLFCIGYKRSIGEFCMEALLEKDIALHVHHEKPDKTDYQSARTRNYHLFSSLHSHRVNQTNRDDPTLLSAFSKLCESKQVSVQELSILYDNKPGHIDRFDTFKRRLRFLLND